jgi:hypothetical protein
VFLFNSAAATSVIALSGFEGRGPARPRTDPDPISVVLFSLTAILQRTSLLLPLFAAVLGTLPCQPLVLHVLFSSARSTRCFPRPQVLLALAVRPEPLVRLAAARPPRPSHLPD